MFWKRFLSAASVLLMLSTPALAQPWPRTPGGGVVLTIQGDRVVIPKPLVDHGDPGGFFGIPTIALRPIGTRLREIIGDPDHFRPLLNNELGGVSLVFNMGWIASRDPAKENDADHLRWSLWLGRFGVSTFEPSLSETREQRTQQQCSRSFMGDQWYEYRNISRLITNEGAPRPRRIFRACAGQFLIHYSIYPHWFVDVPLPVIQDRLVEFFQTMLPDTPIEVFP